MQTAVMLSVRKSSAWLRCANLRGAVTSNALPHHRQTRLPQLSTTNAVFSTTAADEPDYIREQRAKLEAVQRYEEALLSGERLGEATTAEKAFPWVLGAALTALFGSIAYQIWDTQSRKKKAEQFLQAKALEEGWIKRPSGLLYKVIECGSGMHHPTTRSTCTCHYRGTLVDGTEFDSSHVTGRPATLVPSKLIRGWCEALQLMVEGDKWELCVPPELGYANGAEGKIPAGSVLIFELELLQVQGERRPKVQATTTE